MPELKEGDVLINPVDSANPLIVASVTSDTALTLSVAVGSGDSYNGAITRKRNKIDEQAQTSAVFLIARDYVKTHTADAHVETRQEIQEIASGGFTIELSSGNTFTSLDNSNFQFSIVKAGTGSPTFTAGENIDIDELENDNKISRSATTLTVSNLASENGAMF